MNRPAPTESAPALLQVRGLETQDHTRAGIVRAVDGISFDLAAGEVLGLVGESGCGKSVTALSLMRLVQGPVGRIAGGEVIFDGQDLLKLDDAAIRQLRGHRLAMIFQDPMTSLNPVLTIGMQISEALRLHLKMRRKPARERTVELLELVGIPGARKRIDDYPHQFSGGMRQRVMIAMALACRPKLIVADEITTALDVTIQAQILELLRDLAGALGTAFILITHDLGIVAGMTQRVHVMYAGRIVEKARTRDLFASPKMPYTWGLLRSIPRLDQERHERLTPIEGLPPDLIAPPPGCRFATRCQYRREICGQREPELLQITGEPPGHEARCWGVQDVPDGGWLRGVDWRTDLGDTAVLDEIRRSAAQVPAEAGRALPDGDAPDITAERIA
ncbi:MAG: oligopeptide transport system ATP-binding protein [Acidobacteriota bacterium]|nr:oligopeptide transport system ATP-binding protein [Acidobacteriota bacterium]